MLAFDASPNQDLSILDQIVPESSFEDNTVSQRKLSLKEPIPKLQPMIGLNTQERLLDDSDEQLVVRVPHSLPTVSKPLFFDSQAKTVISSGVDKLNSTPTVAKESVPSTTKMPVFYWQSK